MEGRRSGCRSGRWHQYRFENRLGCNPWAWSQGWLRFWAGYGWWIHRRLGWWHYFLKMITTINNDSTFSIKFVALFGFCFMIESIAVPFNSTDNDVFVICTPFPSSIMELTISVEFGNTPVFHRVSMKAGVGYMHIRIFIMKCDTDMGVISCKLTVINVYCTLIKDISTLLVTLTIHKTTVLIQHVCSVFNFDWCAPPCRDATVIRNRLTRKQNKLNDTRSIKNTNVGLLSSECFSTTKLQLNCQKMNYISSADLYHPFLTPLWPWWLFVLILWRKTLTK